MTIGLAAAMSMVLIGRISGISGIAFNGLTAPFKNVWAIAFLAGLALGAFLFHFLLGRPIPALDTTLPLVIAGGLIVGIGTRLSRGCTSGHGICGLALFSNRSIVSVITFMLTAMVAAWVRLHGGWF